MLYLSTFCPPLPRSSSWALISWLWSSSSLVFGVAYSFYQLIWFWSGLFVYCIPTPVSLPKCSQFPCLSLFCCLSSPPIVCFIWVLPTLPLFLSKSCFFQKLPGNEQHGWWRMLGLMQCLSIFQGNQDLQLWRKRKRKKKKKEKNHLYFMMKDFQLFFVTESWTTWTQ